MAVTEEDLDKKREKVERLREQVAEAITQREERERALSLEIESKQLDAEAARLQGELNIAKEMAKVGSVKAGAGDLLDTVKDQEAEATAQAKAAEQSAAKE